MSIEWLFSCPLENAHGCHNTYPNQSCLTMVKESME